MKFADVIGHDDLKAMLRNSVDNGRVSHAQLFTGSAGYGVLSLALAYVQYLNCANRQGGDSCGECPSCRQIEELAHPDLHFVFPTAAPKGWSGQQKPTSSYFMAEWRRLALDTDLCFDEQALYAAIGIDNAQGLIAKKEADEIIRTLSFKSFESEYKTVVVWLPEKMNEEAANKLLKTLEEPWEKTLFLLLSEHPEQLLPTIVSRTQEVGVPRIDPESLTRYGTERMGAQPDEARAAAQLADGSILELRRILSSENRSAEEDNFELFTSLMRLCYSQRHLEIFDWVERVAATGRESQKSFLEYSLGMFRESYMLSAGMNEVSYLWGVERDFCTKFSPFVGNHNIEELVLETESALRDIAQNGNVKIVLTHYALSVSKLIIRKAN